MLPVATANGQIVVSNISPSSGPTEGGTTLTITGTNFGTNVQSATVTIHGNSAVIVTCQTNQITCLTPGGQGAGLALVVTVSGKGSATNSFSYSPPSIYGVSPTSIGTAGGLLDIFGDSLGSTGSVTLGGGTCFATSWNDHEIICVAPAGGGLGKTLLVTVSSQIASTNVNYLGPTLNTMLPSSGTTAGGTLITLTGSNFTASAGTVWFGSSSIAPASWNQTNIQFNLPAGQGLNQAVYVSVNGQDSGSLNFNYSPPGITSIVPASGPTAGATSIVINGTNFGTSGTATLGGAACTGLIVGQTQITCTIPPGQGTNVPLVYSVGGQTATSTSFSYSAPLVTGILPGSGPASGGTVLTVNGLNFGTSGTVTLGGMPCTVTKWTQTQLSVLTPAGVGTNLTLQVTVSGQIATFNQFNYVAPVVTSLLPTHGSTAGGTSLTIQGTNFGTAGQVIIGGVACVISNWNNSQIICVVPAGQGIAPVLVESGGLSSPAGTTFTYDAPLIQVIAPNPVPTAPSQVTISGIDFGASGVVTVGGVVWPTTGWSQTLITAQSKLSQSQGQSLVVTVAGQSNSAPINFAPPTINSLNPTNGPPEGGTRITLTGSNFSSGGVVQIGGLQCPVVSWSDSNVVCVTPTNTGTNLQLTLLAGNQLGFGPSFSYIPTNVPCLPGTYSATGFQPGVPAPPGYFVSASGATSATPAMPGTFVPTSGATMASPATPGTYAPYSAMSFTLPAPAGSYVSSYGASSATLANAGYYVASQGQTGALPAPPGSYCPNAGMVAPILASPGYYVSASASTGQTPAMPGYFAAGPGATNAVAANAGTYCPVSAMPFALPTPPGYYQSSQGQPNAIPAPVGFYSSAYGNLFATPAPPGKYDPIPGMQAPIVPGDLNGDGLVTQDELNVVLTNYWTNSPWVTMTNAQNLGNGIFQFSLTNATAWDFSVLVSSNLATTNWDYLGVAYPVYQFTTTNTNAAALYYKLRWP